MARSRIRSAVRHLKRERAIEREARPAIGDRRDCERTASLAAIDVLERVLSSL